MKKTYRAFILIFILLCVAATSAFSINLTLRGRWRASLTRRQLLQRNTGGTDFQDILESRRPPVQVSVSRIANTTPWRIDIKRVDINWLSHPDLKLEVFRYNDGRGRGSISGGTDYMEVTGFDQQFFTGVGPRSRIKIQYRISGIKAERLNSGNFSTTIYYTVTDNQ